MIVRLGLIVAASIAALTVKQLNVNDTRSGTFAYSIFITYCYYYFYHFTFYHAKCFHLLHVVGYSCKIMFILYVELNCRCGSQNAVKQGLETIKMRLQKRRRSLVLLMVTPRRYSAEVIDFFYFFFYEGYEDFFCIIVLPFCPHMNEKNGNFYLCLRHDLTLVQREEEEQEEVKLINSIINQTDDFEDDILPEFEKLLSGEIDFLSLDEKTDKEKKGGVYETEMANNTSELERLQNLVKELEDREVKLEGELLEYYGLKEQEADFVELQRQLKIKTVEIDMLKMTINSLQEEREKLQEELAHGASAKRELEAAKGKIKELQRQIQLEANQAKTQLLLLKQKVSGLVSKEEEAAKKDVEIGKKLKALNDLEVEVVELKRENKELQHEKQELTVKLNAAESRITELSNVTEVRVTIE